MEDDPLVGSRRPQDRTITPAQQRFMARRAEAAITEIRASHVSMVSHPGRVARVIDAAAEATG